MNGLDLRYLPPGLGQFNDLIEPVVPIPSAGSTTTAAIGANTVYLYRFRVVYPFTVVNGVVFNGATLGTAHLALGIYTSDGTTWTLRGSTPDTAAAGTSTTQSIAFSTPYALAPGTDYWAAFGATDATYTVLRAASTAGAALGLVKNRMLSKASVYSSGLPSTITSPTGVVIPVWIGLTN